MIKRIYKWVENYWYHYKWITLAVVFFVGIIAFMTISSLGGESYDLQVLYTGPRILALDQKDGIESAYSQILFEDFDGDSKKNVLLSDVALYTDEQIQEEYEGSGNASVYVITVNGNSMKDQESIFMQEIVSGESSICMLDPYWYERVKASYGFMTLEDALGYKPDYAADDYSVRLADTEFGQFFSVFDVLPEDTLLCFRNISTVSSFFNRSRTQKRYDYAKQVFRDIIEFEFPEGYIPTPGAESVDTTPQIGMR